MWMCIVLPFFVHSIGHSQNVLLKDHAAIILAGSPVLTGWFRKIALLVNSFHKLKVGNISYEQNIRFDLGETVKKREKWVGADG